MSRKGMTAVAAVVLTMWAFGAVGGDDAESPSGYATSPQQRASQHSTAVRGDGTTPARTAKPAPSMAPARGEQRQRGDEPRLTSGKTRATYLVARVVDGDTLELGNGETVRLVGIDTPEVGECGYDRATDNLERLVLGEQVRLSRSDEDRDRYGRLLRYVDVGDVDAGLRQIRQGLAIARYDSRDGYGYHRREPRYVTADAASRNVSCGGAAGLVAPDEAATMRSGPAGCAAGYRPCVPAYPPDVDCGDLSGPVQVTGTDPHRLDADGDGVACE